MTGYSDRINHALAFAAKHHDRQVHKGTRAPYRTHSSMLAVILSRYEQPDSTVIAGILHDVIEDAVMERHARELLDQRIGQKFGPDTLDIALSITPRLIDDDGLELSHDERRSDLLERLVSADDAGRWVCAADALFEVCSAVANLHRTIDPDSVWNGLPLGRDPTVEWYRRLHHRLTALGFNAPIMTELAAAIDELERWARVPAEDMS
jgi:hypothetical protein